MWANTYNAFDPTSPFGGDKESGFGREGGLHALDGAGRFVMAEVFATSDVQGGVTNTLTGSSTEPLPWMLGHRDIDAVELTGAPADLDASVVGEAADNLKRLVRGEADEQSPYVIADFCGMKTVWHPVGR